MTLHLPAELRQFVSSVQNRHHDRVSFSITFLSISSTLFLVNFVHDCWQRNCDWKEFLSRLQDECTTPQAEPSEQRDLILQLWISQPAIFKHLEAIPAQLETRKPMTFPRVQIKWPKEHENATAHLVRVASTPTGRHRQRVPALLAVHVHVGNPVRVHPLVAPQRRLQIDRTRTGFYQIHLGLAGQAHAEEQDAWQQHDESVNRQMEIVICSWKTWMWK